MTAVAPTQPGEVPSPAGLPGSRGNDRPRDDLDMPPTRFEPVGVVARYPAPRATIDPDRTKGWIRRVWPIVWGHKLLLLVSLAAAVVSMFATVAVPAVTSRAIDQALISKTAPLSRFVIVLVILGVIRGSLAFAYRYGLFRMAYRIETDLRAVIYRHLTRLSFSFYDRTQSGQLISRANSDIRSVQMFLTFAPLIALTILMFFLALAVMLTISIPLTVLSVLTLPPVYFIGVHLRNKIFPLSWVVQARLADVATIVDENVNGVRVVKSFAQERQQIRSLARAARKLQWANVATVDARARYSPVMENLPRVGLVVVLLYGGWLVIDGQLQLGVLVAFNAYILMMQMPFRVLGFFMMLQQRAAASADRIFEVLDEQPEVTDRPGAVDLEACEGLIELRDVSFGYPQGGDAGAPPGRLVLEHLDLRIEPGDSVAIVGRTGSGKSTIARLLPRFYDVTGGAVLIDGNDVRDLTLFSLRSEIGLVLDEPFLFSTSVRDNIAYGRPDASFEEVVDAAKAAQAHEFIEQLPDGYDSVIGERGYTLSGGQRQRIAIARTLLVNPRILVLDDATSAIDVQVEHEIHEALEHLLEGRTTIVIAHRLSTIALARRVVLLEDGHVVATGTHQELMANEPRYAEVLARGEQDDTATPGTDGDGEAGVPADEDDLHYRLRIAMQVNQGRSRDSAPPAGLGGPGGIGGLR